MAEVHRSFRARADAQTTTVGSRSQLRIGRARGTRVASAAHREQVGHVYGEPVDHAEASVAGDRHGITGQIRLLEDAALDHRSCPRRQNDPATRFRNALFVEDETAVDDEVHDLASECDAHTRVAGRAGYGTE